MVATRPDLSVASQLVQGKLTLVEQSALEMCSGAVLALVCLPHMTVELILVEKGFCAASAWALERQLLGMEYLNVAQQIWALKFQDPGAEHARKVRICEFWSEIE